VESGTPLNNSTIHISVRTTMQDDRGPMKDGSYP
jgi:hypothetical protein